MPISYRIDSSRNLILTTASGSLTDADLLELKRQLAADPAVTEGMRELSDVRRVTELRVTAEGVRDMVALDSSHSAKAAGYRLAIVVEKDDVFGMARMYQTLTERNLPQVAVFRDYEAATQWLGVPSESNS